MATISSVSAPAVNVVNDVAHVAKATKGSPELRRELLGQVAERVGKGEYVKAELTAQAAETLSKSPSYQPGQLLNKVV